MSRNTREGAQAFEGPKGFESNKLFEHGGDSEQTQEKMEIQPLGPVQGRSSRSVSVRDDKAQGICPWKTDTKFISTLTVHFLSHLLCILSTIQITKILTANIHCMPVPVISTPCTLFP